MGQVSMDRSSPLFVSDLVCQYRQRFLCLIHCHLQERCFHWRKNIKLVHSPGTSIATGQMRTAPMLMLRCWRELCRAWNAKCRVAFRALPFTNFCIALMIRGLLC